MNKKNKNEMPEDDQIEGQEAIEEFPESELSEPQEEVRRSETAQSQTADLSVEELKDHLQRLAADYHNYQKRSDRLIEQAGQLAQENLIRSLLPALDNFEHILSQGDQINEADKTLYEAVKIVYDHLVGTLEKAGLRRIEVAIGDRFDPRYHEAMMHEESDNQPENAIMRELARGYLMNDRVLRPVRVSVAKKIPPQTDADEQKIRQQELDSSQPGQPEES